MKKKSLLSCLIGIIFIPVIIFSACEIGLGASVDVEAPKIDFSDATITSGAVVRDDFAVFGRWEDDGSIGSITATLKNLSTGSEFQKEGAINEDNSWSISFSPENEGIDDGSYELSILIKDSADHETKISRAFTIDNTPPLVVLSRPSTRLGATLAGTSAFDSYGQKFTLEGKAADDNDVSLIEVNVYDNSACSGAPLKTISLPNVPLTIESDVAEFSSTIPNDYAVIYGHVDGRGVAQRDGGDSYRYCKLVVYDGAQRFPADGSAQSEDDKKGNSVDYYYLNSDISSLFTEGYKITELYHILNGTYSGSARSTGPDGVISLLNSSSVKVGVGQFKINPENSPKFVVSARNPLQEGDNFSSNSFDMTNGNNFLEIEVSPGLDGHLIRQDTIGVYLVRCDNTGTNLLKTNGEIAANEDEAKTIWLINPGAQNYDTYQSNVPLADQAQITQSGSSYKFKTLRQIGTEYYTTMATGENYLIRVVGRDEAPGNGNEIMSDGPYGFRLITSGLNIEVRTSKSTEWISTASNANSANRSPVVTLDYAIDNKPFAIHRSFAAEGSGIETSSPIISGLETTPYTDSISSTSFTIDSTVIPNTATVYYLVKGKDASESNLKNETFKLDNNPPQVAITEYPNPTPTGQTSITLRGTATDYARNSANTGYTTTELSGVKKVYIQIIDGRNNNKKTKAYDDSTITPTELQKITASLSDGTWMCQINPSDYSGTDGAFEDKGTKTIKVTAIDGVGLKSTVTTTFDYDTANPVVTITGSQLSEESQVTTIPSSVGKPIKLRGTVSDDYKIKRIRLRQTKDGGSPVETTIEDFSTPITAASTTPHSWETPDLPLQSDGTPYTLEQLRTDPSDTDGTYTYEIVVEDAAGLTATPAATTGKTSSTSKTIILKTPLPTITFDSPFNYTNETASTWQTSTSVSISGTATPNGSSNELSISKVYWKLISATSYDSATAPAAPVLPTENVLDSSSWTGWNTATGTTSWFINLTSDSGLTNSILTPTTTGVTGPLHNRIYIACVDTAGNVSTIYDRIIKVDSTVPTLTANYYQIGSGEITAVPSTGVSSLYIQDDSSLTLYGNYSDEQSGVSELSFQLGEGAITPSTSYSATPVTTSTTGGVITVTNTYSNSVNATAKSWKAVFTPEANGNLSVTGVNGATRDKPITVFNLTIDYDVPSLLNIALKETKGSSTYDAYLKPTDSKYYINNTAAAGKSYKITGVVSDLGGIDTLSIAVTNTGNTSNTLDIPSIQNANGTFVFELINSQRTAMQDWSNGATAVITARDKSGRSVSQTVNIVFDSTPPKAMHWADAKNKDIYFRIGNAENDNVTAATDSDVGSKYSFESWGNKSSITIRGTFDEASTGSGLKAIHYAILSSEPTDVQINTIVDGRSLSGSSVITTGSFEPLTSPETKTVIYNKNSSGTSTGSKSVTSNFKKENLAGFNADTNYLILIAEDNAGNRAPDNLIVTEGTTITNGERVNNGSAATSAEATNTWNTSKNYYRIQKDTDAPAITSTESDTVYTNGNANADSIDVSGTVSDGYGSGVDSVILTISGLSSFSQTATIENGNWSSSITADTFASAVTGSSYQIKATAKDKAGEGNSSEITARTIIVDKKGPKITISTPAQAAKVGASNFVISGNANDGNGAGLSTAAGSMKLYYTTSSSLGGATTAPESITTGTVPASTWVELEDGAITVNSDNTWQSSSTSPFSLTSIAAENANTNLYFIISAKDSSGTGNTGYSVPRKVTVDRKTPVFVSGTAGGSSNAETWLNTRTVNISGSFEDPSTGSGSTAIAGSGVSTIKYQVGSAAEQSLPTSDGSYDKTISLANTVTQETIKVWAVDAAGNEIPTTDTTNRKSYTIKIDTTAPTLTANYYRKGSDTSVPLTAPSGTIYMKPQTGGTSFTLYGNYKDETSGSGIKNLVFKNGGNEFTPTSIDYSTTEITGTNGTVPADYGVYDADSATSYKSWKAVFNVTASGRITVEGEDLAGNSVSVSALDIMIDNTPPVVSNIKFNVTTGTGSSAVTNEVYSATSDGATNYYLNNTVSGKTFTITGLATDDVGLESVSINITNTAESPATALTYSIPNPNGNWTYTVGDWSTWDTGANVTITVTDKAGNTVNSTPLNVIFDTVPPIVNDSKLKTPSSNQTESKLFKFEGEAGCVAPEGSDIVFSGYDKVDILFTETDTNPGADASEQTIAYVAVNGSWSSTIEFDSDDFGTIFNTQGTKYLWVRAYDNAGNAGEWVSKSFVYDTATPTISFTPTAATTNPAADSFRNNGFKLEVNASDTYGVQSVQVIYGRKNATTTSTATATINSEGKYEMSFIVGNEQAQNTAATHLANGEYTFTVRVTDNSGKTNEVTRSFSIDTTAPVIDMSNTSVTRTADYLTNWHKTNQIPVTVSVSDTGAGIGAVQVSTDGTNFTNPTTLMQSDSGWTGTIICGAQGENTIYIKATDAVGNATTVNSTNALTVNVDTTPPSDPIFLGISTGSGDDLTATPASDITSVLVNKTVPVTVYAALIDEGASTVRTGIPTDSTAVALKQKGKTGSSTYIASRADLPTEIKNHIPDDVTDDYLFWSYEILETDMKSGGMSFTLKDYAGNEADYVLFQMTVDTTKPTVTFNPISNLNLERAANDSDIYVNGTIELSGTANDNQKLESVKVEYKKSSDADTAANWHEITTKPSSSTLASWSRTLDTTALDDETEYVIRVSATDSAGNSTDNTATSTTLSARTQTVKVSQDTDRPIIKFTNLTLPETMSATGRISFRNEELYGNVTDDDGIPRSLEYYYGTGTPVDSDWKTTPNLSYSSGSFTLKFKDADDKNDDGEHHLYFRVTDASGTTGKAFKSQGVVTAASTIPDIPKVIDNSTSNSHKFGYITRSNTTPVTYSATTTVTYLTVDTTDPYRGNLKFSTDYNESTPTWQEKTDITAIPFGGDRNSFKIKIPAWDINGVTISMTIEGYTGTITFTETDESAGDAIYTEAKYWLSSEITIPATMESGVKACTIDVFDGVRHNKDDFSISVDNTAPVINATSPSSTQYSSGNVIAYGETDLTYWKNTSSTDTPREFMYYALSLDDTTTPAADYAHRNSAAAITSWKDEDGISGSLVDDAEGNAKTYKPYYTPILGGSFNWYIYFDGSASTDGETHDATFRNFLVNSGVTTQALLDTTNQTQKFRTKVKAYLWIKAVDQVGNKTVIKHPILIDPQGDAPNVSIDYPEASGTTLGGAITLRGSANDTKGSHPGVDSVWLQIISSIENGYDSSADASHTTGTRTAGGLVFEDAVTSSGSGSNITYSHAYTLNSFAPTLKDVKQWILRGYQVYKDITTIDDASTTAVEGPTAVTSVTGADTADGSEYFIKASFSGSAWNLKINDHGEFNPAGGKLNPIAYRIFAKDKDGNLSSYEQQLSVYDSDNPVISNVYLRQYENNAAGTGTVTASRAYEDDMWVKGTWWLCGTVKDTQGLSKLEVGPATEKVNQNPSGSANTAETFKYKLGTGSGVGKLTIVIEAADIANEGQNPHTTTKECVINYDNEDPELLGTTAANFNIKSAVQNSNGFYTFGSQVMENPVGNDAQSGFDYLAFWFEREITGTNGKHVVYDVMRPKAQTSGDTVVNTSEVAWADLATFTNAADARGLKWKSKTVTRSQSELGHLTFTGTDANIHVGGLCMVQGSIYMINSVETTGTGASASTTVGIDGQPEYTTSQTAYFAIANVVNNTVEAGSGAKSTADGMYGYYSTMSNDDGDHMVESVSKQGSTWTWEANINSQNIADGSITLHYVAFDKAGNFKTEHVDGNIANNAPRIASLEVWSDFNENGTKDEGESDTKYFSEKERKVGGSYGKRATAVTSELVVSGNDKDYTLADGDSEYGSAFMTVKATTTFIPELVGGNKALYYTYKYGDKSHLETATVHYGAASIGNGNDDGIDEDVNSTGYYQADQNGSAYIVGDKSHQMVIYGGADDNDEDDDNYTLYALNNSTSATDPTWFEYTIYDSTEGSSSTWNATTHDTTGRLSAKFRVALNVQYRDSSRPVVKIRPFYWNSLTDNSVYTAKALEDVTSVADLEGHIELENDLPTSFTTGGSGVNDRDPKVSGVIKIEGYAFDDIKLKELYVQMSDHSSLASRTTAVSTYNGSWTQTAYDESTGWGFTVEDVYCNANGHLVKWTLIVDTAKRTTQAQANQTVVVYAVDARGTAETNTSYHNEENQTKLTPQLWGDVKGNANANSTYYTDFCCNTPVTSSTADTTVVYKESDLEDMTYYYKMDIVPYITSIETDLSSLKRTNPSVYNRTALGHYPVRIGETITFNGYNLGTNTTLAITDTMTSSAYQFTVGGIQAINNLNDNNSKGNYTKTVNLTQKPAGDKTVYNNYYNRQPNGDNNNLLTDDVWLDVWQFNNRAAVPISGKIEQPVMKIRPTDGKIGFAFVNGPLFFSMGGSPSTEDYSYQYWTGSYDLWSSIGFTYDSFGNSYGVGAGGDSNAAEGDAFILVSSKFGRGLKGQRGSYDGYHTLRLERIAQNNSGTTDIDKQRIKSPSIVTSPNGATQSNVYLAYYDGMNDEIRFKSGTTVTETSWVRKLQQLDGNGYTGGWISKTEGGTTMANVAAGDLVYFCDENGNVGSDTTAYRLFGYWEETINGKDYIAFQISNNNGDNPQTPFTQPLGKQSNNYNNYPQGFRNGFKNISNDNVYIKIVKAVKEFGQFMDSANTSNPGYNATYVSILASDTTTYKTGGYLSLGVVPASITGNKDRVVAVWLDQANPALPVLRYAYNSDPVNNPGSWTYVSRVFPENSDYAYAGEYCKVAVDAEGGVHIAAYNQKNLDLVYTYLPADKKGAAESTSDFKSCVVDSNGVVGSNLNIDVGKNDEGKIVPYISYYATSIIRPKVAYYVGGFSSTDTIAAGAVDDLHTGKWECINVPTDSSVEMQSLQHNDINIGLWKDDGVIVDSSSDKYTTGTSSTYNNASSYNSNSYGQIYGNGTSNPVLGYAIKVDSKNGAIETAQMQ